MEVQCTDKHSTNMFLGLCEERMASDYKLSSAEVAHM